MKITEITVDLPLRPLNADRYTPYERIALTASVEEGEDLDKVYQDLQLEIQRMYFTKHIPEDGFMQVMQQAANKEIPSSVPRSTNRPDPAF